MSPPDLLNLPAYRTLHVDTNDHDYDISAEIIPKPAPSTQIEKPEKNYGVDISTLTRMIENGEL
jgi:hypothetical protein